MKQICVISGKGGTGKSSITASLALLCPTHSVIADCDVDAANMALFFEDKPIEETPFWAGTRAVIDLNQCTNCGECPEICRYNAIVSINNTYQVDTNKCEGCHACSVVCQADAIAFEKNHAGTMFVTPIDVGVVVHAELYPAQDNSGKLVSSVRAKANKIAKEKQINTIFIDGPPGIGCPVHASLTGVDAAIVVTEPSVSGIHDMERVVKLCKHFKIDAFVIINKYNLSESQCKTIEQSAKKNNVTILGKIPFDKAIPLAQNDGKTIYHLSQHKKNLESIWDQMESNMELR